MSLASVLVFAIIQIPNEHLCDKYAKDSFHSVSDLCFSLLGTSEVKHKQGSIIVAPTDKWKKSKTKIQTLQ